MDVLVFVFCLSNFMTLFILCNIISMRSAKKFSIWKKIWYLLWGNLFSVYGIVLANCQIERYHAPRSIRRSQRWWGERGRCLDSCSFMTYDWARIHSTDRTEHHHHHLLGCTLSQWITCHMSFNLTIIYKLNDFLTDCLLF